MTHGPIRRLIGQRPVAAYFTLAYAFSWVIWVPLGVADQVEGVGQLLFLLGGFGPLAAAATVTRATGGSVRQWLRSIFRFRVHVRWYLAAVLLYPIVVALATVEYALLGQETDLSLLDERLVGYLPTLIFVALIGGGQEEPGWRGFALPRLQERMSPFRATLVLGVLWALWHLPILLTSENPDHGLSVIAFVGVLLVLVCGIAVGYATALTYLWNRTASVVPCILLHASFNTANGMAGLQSEDDLVEGAYATISVCLTGTLVVLMLLLVHRTGGRLGLDKGAGMRTAMPSARESAAS